MGNSSWESTDWQVHRSATQGKTQQEIFQQQTLKDELNPAKFPYREARDSQANPKSTPIILAGDITGSMGIIATKIIKEDLGKVMDSLYKNKPVTDPAICAMAIGDFFIDQAPIQATQFESDIRLAEQMTNFYIEGGGGGNGGESYSAIWLFALAKTKSDIHKKRNKKGYIFTIGDECCHPILRKHDIKRFLDLDAEADMDSATLLAQVQKDWEIFHLIINPLPGQDVVASWRKLLGERAILLPNLEHLAEGITTAIEVVEGAAISGDKTSLVVRQVSTALAKT